MLPQASFASSSRTIQYLGQHTRPGPNPLNNHRRIAFNIESIKISQQPKAVNLEQPTLNNPVQIMFVRFQERFKEQGK